MPKRATTWVLENETSAPACVLVGDDVCGKFRPVVFGEADALEELVELKVPYAVKFWSADGL